jgi:lysophospholipid acyltransferase (LPLAT)-like uncharacterized protein
MKAWWRRIRPRILPPLIYGLIRLLLSTVKIDMVNYSEPKSGGIISGWHGRIILATKAFRGRGYWTMISQSRDGELQYGIFRRLGFNSIRGSTGRGGIKALMEAVRELKKGAVLCFTPDGPRGPSGVVQGGLMVMAKKSGQPIIPIGMATNRRWLIKSWDRYMVPKPFSRGVMVFGDPIYVPAEATDEEVERLRQVAELAIHQAEVAAEEYFNHPKPNWHAPEAITTP